MRHSALVAQRTRASDYGSEGCRFESCRARCVKVQVRGLYRPETAASSSGHPYRNPYSCRDEPPVIGIWRSSIERAKRGTGSIRERLPGVWEIRVVVGFDPVHARSVQRSFTVHGDKEAAEQRRRELVADFGISRIAFASEASRLTVAELLERFFAAPHLWKPATVASHQSRHSSPRRRFTCGRRRLVALTPGDVRAAICRWQSAGQSVSTVSSRWLVLRSALSWAVSEGVLRSNPLGGMRGPGSTRAASAPYAERGPADLAIGRGQCGEGSDRGSMRTSSRPGCSAVLFSAEQGLLLVRLAADSGARRGELAVLRFGDLEGRVLTIERGVSRGVVGSTKVQADPPFDARIDYCIAHPCPLFCVGRALARPRGTTGCSHPTRCEETFMTADALSHKFRRLGSWLVSRIRRCIVSDMGWPPISLTRANCSRHRLGSGTATLRRRFGTTRTRLLSMTKTSPMNSTHY